VPLLVRPVPHIPAVHAQPHVGRQPGRVRRPVPPVVRLAGHVPDRRLAHRTGTGRAVDHPLRTVVRPARAHTVGRPPRLRHRGIRL